jgi:hypothetical protein
MNMISRRRRVVLVSLAAFALGIAFAAQPTYLASHRRPAETDPRAHWVPGTTVPMSAYEMGVASVAPPR